MPFFSVIMPTYNRGLKIYPSIDSVFAQTDGDWELLVVDDGSTDDTFAQLLAYQAKTSDSRLRIILQKNGGTTSARNNAITAAAGRYITFLDHDDLYLPWTLASHRKAIESNGMASISSGTVVRDDLPSPQDRALIARYFECFLAAPQELLQVYPSGWAIAGEAIKRVEGFFPLNCGYEDIDLMLRLGSARGFVRIIEPAVAIRGIHANNLSSDRHRAWFDRGLHILLQREKGGQYPGGFQYAWERRSIICAAGRALSLTFARYGACGQAFKFYWATLHWHFRMGRVRYLMALPAFTLVGWLRKITSARTPN